MPDISQPENPISYEQLEQLEDEFEQVDLEMLRHQAMLTKDLYARRTKLIADIPHFWPLVLEQSPPELDDFIQPSDAALLLESLKSLSVERFELPEGDPRSLAIRFEFSDNEHFDGVTLEKKFWWRCHKDGWEGHVSEPVNIKWKADKDLTGGILDLACKLWDEDKAGSTGETATKKKLKEKMEETGLGGLSFFAWFGFRGRDVSAEHDQEARKYYAERRQARKEGKEVEDENEDENESGPDEYEYEIFPTADDIAVAIAEDLWPGAVKYFIQAQEQDGMSDASFESDVDEMMGDVEGGPRRKVKGEKK